MCTVSFINTNGKIIITSNRDEQIIRPSALPPKAYEVNQKIVIFPKDQKAGGTWFAVNENGVVLVLLNGAAEKHILQSSYRKSRGLIVLDIISQEFPINFWNEINLENIEPFTLVLYQNKQLFQLQWNGISKDKVALNANENHIWSSSTLYQKYIREKRRQWFFDFLNTNHSNEIDDQKMLQFHRHTEDNNLENGLVINRNENLKTLSITQTVLEKNNAVISHLDLIQEKDFTTSFTII